MPSQTSPPVQALCTLGWPITKRLAFFWHFPSTPPENFLDLSSKLNSMWPGPRVSLCLDSITHFGRKHPPVASCGRGCIAGKFSENVHVWKDLYSTLKLYWEFSWVQNSSCINNLPLIFGRHCPIDFQFAMWFRPSVGSDCLFCVSICVSPTPTPAPAGLSGLFLIPHVLKLDNNVPWTCFFFFSSVGWVPGRCFWPGNSFLSVWGNVFLLKLLIQ